MIKEMIVSSTALETKIAILEDDQLAELYIERNRNRGILGNIYKGRVTKVLPGMQSAFVNVGLEKDSFLYVSDFIEDTEEYDKVLTEAEEQVATALAEIEVQERPQPQARKDQRPERRKWRDKKDRSESSRAVSAPQVPSLPAADTIEIWMLAAETQRITSPEELARGTETPDLPPSCGLVPETAERNPETFSSRVPDAAGVVRSQADGADTAQFAQEPGPDDTPLNSAIIKENEKISSFSLEGEDNKSGFNVRRGGAARRKRHSVAHRNNRPEHQLIGDILKEGQEILVQVAKEPIAKKGARVTSHIALPGRYLVYMPTVEHVGVSRKIASDAERLRLKDIILKHRDHFPGGVIVRTAAEEHSEEDLVNDLKFLVKIWEDIRIRADKASAPTLIHAEMNLVQRLLRDQFSFEFASIRVDDETEYQKVIEFVDKIYPNLLHRVKLHTKDSYIFDEYGITPEIEKLLQPKIWLKSGGYIVINQTEALVSIDINTGKFVGRGNSLEETITRINIEAVKEIVKQIRLRDLGGIIVIDFIDMDERKNRKRVMEALSQELTRDKAPSKILEFNEFGLVAITRKRVKQSLERTLCQPCQYCGGSGLVKSVATTCYSIYHEVEKMKEDAEGRTEVMIRVHPDVARALRESEAAVVEEMRHVLKKDVVIKSDPSLHIEHFNIVTQ
jgi:Rne/Rng family ribonuclease